MRIAPADRPQVAADGPFLRIERTVTKIGRRDGRRSTLRTLDEIPSMQNSFVPRKTLVMTTPMPTSAALNSEALMEYETGTPATLTAARNQLPGESFTGVLLV